jgi:hypothetical protein
MIAAVSFFVNPVPSARIVIISAFVIGENLSG